MRDLLTFLRDHKLAWLTPIGIVLALLFWLAWSITDSPENPFEYRAY